MKNRITFILRIVVSILLISLVVFILILRIIADRDQRLIKKAKEDGRWEQFEDCINAHPSDAVCDSCWYTIIDKRKK
jgi:hypothetical protein